MLKINYNENTYEYKVWKHPELNSYFVELTDETTIPIEIVKEAIEEFYNIEIKSYCVNGHKRYAKDNYKESNEFTYYFSVKDKE